jgi:hypothetical protein
MLVTLAFLLTDHLLTPPLEPGVTEVNVKRLRPGMTRDQVEGILWPAPRIKYRLAMCRVVWVCVSNEQPGDAEEARPALVVEGKQGIALLYFGNGDYLRWARWAPNAGAPLPETGLFSRLRKWLGW